MKPGRFSSHPDEAESRLFKAKSRHNRDSIFRKNSLFQYGKRPALKIFLEILIAKDVLACLKFLKSI